MNDSTAIIRTYTMPCGMIVPEYDGKALRWLRRASEHEAAAEHREAVGLHSVGRRRAALSLRRRAVARMSRL
jgi:hypothetical protein